MKKLLLTTCIASLLVMTGCRREAEVASYNLSRDADEFRIMRRVTVFNNIKDIALFSVEGNCSVERDMRALLLTCKQGSNEYKKHIIGLSDNVSYVVEQLAFDEQNPYRLKFIFKPQEIFSLPNWEVK